MTERKIYYIDGKRYWRMEQTHALQVHDGNYGYGNNDVCTGCVFREMRSHDFTCREVTDPRLISDNQPLRCQDYEPDEDSINPDGKYEDYTITNDYIFIPATRAGLAHYVAHKLEAS